MPVKEIIHQSGTLPGIDDQGSSDNYDVIYALRTAHQNQSHLLVLED
jgi:hypothetical protein